jgi:membrane-associated protease RseP (regulator of RpoE activity)
MSRQFPNSRAQFGALLPKSIRPRRREEVEAGREGKTESRAFPLYSSRLPSRSWRLRGRISEFCQRLISHGCLATLFTAALSVSALLSSAPRALAADADAAQKLYDKTTRSLVVVKFTYAGEVDQAELTVAGIVVNDQGLVMIPLAAVNEEYPDEQLKKFKILVPRLDGDPKEVEAEFEGRDERANVAFVMAKPAADDKEKHVWTPIHFQAISPKIGEPIYSVGLLPKGAGYRSYFTASVVSADLRDAIKQTMVAGGGLCAQGSPVFDAEGDAIGVVTYQPPFSPYLEQDPKMSFVQTLTTNKLYTPASEFLVGLNDPPTPDHPVPLAYAGVVDLSGLAQDVAEVFNLKDQPAIQIGGIMPGSPAEKAGIKKKEIITKLNGEPLPRGDDSQLLPMIMSRKLLLFKPGTEITLTLMDPKDKSSHDVKLTLEARPKRSNLAKRYWSEDIGFGVREIVTLDRYVRKLKPEDKDGVIVTTLKPNSSAASAGLQPEDMITMVNGQAVTTLDEFKKAYEDFRKAHEHEAIVLLVKREGHDQTIRIEPPQ